MRPGKQVKVTVASAATHRPIEGAQVSLGYPDRRKATTGSDGVAIVRGLLPDKYEITVLAAGYAHEERSVDLANSASVTPLSLALTQGGLVQGKLTDKDERPLAGVRVYYRSVGSTYGYFGQSPTTDEQGRYRNAHLPLETQIEISYSSEDYLPAKKVVSLTRDAREQQVDMKLEKRPRGGSVAGVVTDPEGKPIAGAKVGNYGNRSDEMRETTTDTTGRFVLHDLLKDHVGHEIVVRARGFSPVLRRVEPGPEGAPSEASVRLQRGHFLHGRVENGAGEPIKGALVWISNRSGPFQAFESVQADEQGRFHLDSLDQGNSLRISAEGYSTRENVTLPFDGDEIISVKLEPMGVLRGRVVDAATGQAIKQFRVRLGFPTEFRAGDVRGTFDSRLGEPGRAFQAEDGTFTLGGLTNRLALAITVEADGYQRSTLPRHEAQPAGGAIPLQITLTKTDPGSTIPNGLRHALLDHRRKPAARAFRVRLIVSTLPHRRGKTTTDLIGKAIDMNGTRSSAVCCSIFERVAVTDTQGRFAFRDVLPGMYLQLACYTGVQDASIAVAGLRENEGRDWLKPSRSMCPSQRAITGSFGWRDIFRFEGRSPYRRKDEPVQQLFSSELSRRTGRIPIRERVPRHLLVVCHAQARTQYGPPRANVHPPADRCTLAEGGTGRCLQGPVHREGPGQAVTLQ